MFGIISVSRKFVPIFFGEGFEKVSNLIIIISPILVFIGLSNVIGIQYLLPTKQQKEFTISVTIGAIINFCLNMILIRLWKSVGASIATVIAEFTVTGVQFYLVKKEIRFWEVVKLAKNYMISSVLMFGGSLLIGWIIKDSIFSIIIQVFVSILIYFAFLLLLKDDLIIEGTKKVKNKLN